MTGDNFSEGDSFTETSSQGWLSRIGGSIKGMIFGVILFIVSIPVLWMNEGCAVKTAKGLESGAAQVASVSSVSVDASNQGKLIHTTGNLVVGVPAKDTQFSVAPENALSVSRDVEMYQWQEHSQSETKKKMGGGTETVTTYSYDTDWSSTVNNSSSFKKSQGHTNPGSMPIAEKTFTASGVKLGAYSADPIISEISGSQDVDDAGLAAAANVSVGDRTGSVQGGYLYFGDPLNPQVGDVRISFDYVPAGEISVVAQQNGNSFTGFKTEYDTTILLVDRGNKPAEQMFQAAQDANVTRTWLVRLGGIVIMFIGLMMLMKPLSVLGDVLPMLGDIVGFGLGIIAGGLSLLISMIVIALAWIAYRPVLAIILIGVGVAAIAASIFLKKKVAPPPPPPAAAPAGGGTPPVPPA